MTAKWFLLFFFAICAAGTIDKRDIVYKPPCETLTGLIYCPLPEAPVCGTDGETYNNMCDLCNYMALTGEDIYVMKVGRC